MRGAKRDAWARGQDRAEVYPTTYSPASRYAGGRYAIRGSVRMKGLLTKADAHATLLHLGYRRDR